MFCPTVDGIVAHYGLLERSTSSQQRCRVSAFMASRPHGKGIEVAMARSFQEQDEAAAAGVPLESVARLRAEVSKRMLQELAEASVE